MNAKQARLISRTSAPIVHSSFVLLFLVRLRVVAFARANLRAACDAAHFDADRAETIVARFVRRIIAETVLRADKLGDFDEGLSRVAQIARDVGFPAGDARYLVHLAARQRV